MDGFQLCRNCKKDEKLRNIPFIFYTASYTEKKDEEFGLSLGAEKFIVKPISPDHFIEIIKDVLKKPLHFICQNSNRKREDVFLKKVQ